MRAYGGARLQPTRGDERGVSDARAAQSGRTRSAPSRVRRGLEPRTRAGRGAERTAAPRAVASRVSIDDCRLVTRLK